MENFLNILGTVGRNPDRSSYYKIKESQADLKPKQIVNDRFDKPKIKFTKQQEHWISQMEVLQKQIDEENRKWFLKRDNKKIDGLVNEQSAIAAKFI